MMKRITKRIISTMLCLCMLAGMIFTSGGVQALAESMNIGTALPEKIKPKTDAKLGTEENPFTVLEIVPSYELAQFGYFIAGCEPVNMEKLKYTDKYTNDLFADGGHFSKTYNVSYETVYAFYDQIPENSELPVLAWSEQFKTRSLTYIDKEQGSYGFWKEGASNPNYEQRGDYIEVEEGKGNFSKKYVWWPVEGESYVYVGEGQGNYRWEPSESGSTIRKPNGDLFSYKYIKYENTNVLLKYAYDLTDEEAKNFKAQVITMIPSDLQNNLELIDEADLITIHASSGINGDGKNGLASLYFEYNENGHTGVAGNTYNKTFFDPGCDLTCDEVFRIVKRMASDNPAALIMDKGAEKGIFGKENAKKEYNCHKLLYMVLTYKPKVFYENFGQDDFDKYFDTYTGADGTEKIRYKGGAKSPTDENEGAYPPDKFWGIRYTTPTEWTTRQTTAVNPFLYLPDSDVCFLNQMRCNMVDPGGWDVFEKIYTYPSDCSMASALLNDEKNITERDFWSNSLTEPVGGGINSDLFCSDENIGESSLSSLDVMRFILGGGSSGVLKQKLRILEIQPCNKFIYDNSSAEKKSIWKTYYRSLFPWFGPKDATDDKWMEDTNYLQIDTMTTYEFIGSVGVYDYDGNLDKNLLTADSSDDLIAKYDMIIIGSNQDESNGLNGYNDTSLDHLIYTSVGDLIVSDSNIKKYVKDENGNLVPADLSNEINDRKCRYSGNDLTLKKILELQDFLRAGKPVVVDDGLYQITNQGGVPKCEVDTTKVDKSSKLYDLLTWTDSSSYNGSQNLFIHGQINSSFMKKTLAYEYCRLTFYQPQNLTESPYPVEYNYSTKDTSYGKDAIDQAVYTSKNADGTATLKYYFTIQGSAAKDYRVYINIDGDGDGVYTGSLKNMTEVVRMNEALGYAKEDDYSVNAGGWKLKDGISLNNSAAKFDTTESARSLHIYKEDGTTYLGKSNTVLLDANTRYCATIDIPSNQQGIIPWKLEVHEEKNPYLRSSAIDYTAVLNQSETEKLNVLQMCPTSDMKTNPPVLYFTRQKVKVNGVFNSAIEYTTQSEPMTLTGNTLTNVNKFETFLEPVKEFNVNIQFLMNKDWRTLFQVTGMSESDKLANWKAFLSQYDMIILGFKDMANFTNDKVFVDGLKDFIAQGKSVIVSHDMAQYEPNDGGGVGADTANYKYMPWLTTVSGQRRAYYNKSGDTYVKSYSETYQNGELLSLLTGVGDGDTFIRQLSEEIDGDSIEDELIGTWVNDFINNPNRLLPYMNGKGNVDRTNLKYDRLNNTINLSWPPTTTKVALTNQGQITRYPYRLGNEINVAKTHTQYYQLDLEYEKGGDVNVWFNLTDGPYNTYKSRYQDSRNNFFIYNKGNITYTGSGHRAGDLMPDDEVKLFINTMIAAYRVPEAKPAIEITNADTTGNNDVSVIYLDTDENITGTSVDGNVIERDGQKVVAVKFRIIDTAETSSGGDKKHKLLLYKDGSMVDGRNMAIYHYNWNTDEMGTQLLNFQENKTGQWGYEVTASEQGDDYIMFVPYSEISTNGNSTYRLSTYATYKSGESATEKATPTSSANVTIMFMPLFNLN
ncbi:MAG: DUF5057 domain-containing protein [Agathobacter sp.]|nr:DUF5057 domain-containing protein [Agathobacter sp.]